MSDKTIELNIPIVDDPRRTFYILRNIIEIKEGANISIRSIDGVGNVFESDIDGLLLHKFKVVYEIHKAEIDELEIGNHLRKRFGLPIKPK